MLEDDDKSLRHFGTQHESGRYPYGSGENPYQSEQRGHGYSSFLIQYRQLKESGLSKVDIAKSMGMSTTRLTAAISAATEAEKAAEMSRLNRLKAHGYSNSEIARKLGVTEGKVRYMLKNAEAYEVSKALATANLIKEEIAKGKYVEAGLGTEYALDIPKQKLAAAIEILRQEGYTVETIQIEQTTNSRFKTNNLVIAAPGTDKKEIKQNIDNIKQLGPEYHSPDNGDTFDKLVYPASIDSKRVMIRYNEEGGVDKDGTIEIRPGVADVSLGGVNYAQVRILVDNKSYMKGMAFYNEDMPEGVDIIYNSNKPIGTPPEKVFKDIKTDNPLNPFGASIKVGGQVYYEDENGERKLGVINKLKEEGEWSEYSKTVSRQFLSKQNKELISSQLKLSFEDYQEQYDEIMKITNPELKKKKLIEFADACDGASAHLKASFFPGQSTKVILPVPSLNDDEVYAPTFENGTKLALVRYPHAGTFEIPIVTVNNRNKEGKDIVKPGSIDAIGINKSVADILSGADFDGDTVTVIPVTKNTPIQNRKPLQGLKNFNPEKEFPYYEGMKTMPKSSIGREMGEISNLITDMTLQGATDEELTRAVKHSMVVIDAYKHKYNYKLSEEVNAIEALKKRYQMKDNGKYGGASTLISLSTSTEYVPERKLQTSINPKTGEKITYNTNRKYPKLNKKTGEWEYVEATEKVEKGLLTKDLNTLNSGTAQEILYVKYGNSLKTLANTARKSYLAVENTKVNPAAKSTYAEEISSLNSKIKLAEANKPREREAQRIAAAEVREYRKNYAAELETGEISKEDLKKFKNQCLVNARAKTGSSKKDVVIKVTPKEYEAIMSGAVSSNIINKILANTDDSIMELAKPKTTVKLNDAKLNLAKSMAARGFTLNDIAERLGVSTTLISKSLKE